MTRYLGIDPGLSGALAIVETINGVPALIDATDMPAAGIGAKARVDIIAAAQWIAKHAPSMAAGAFAELQHDVTMQATLQNWRKRS